MCEKIIINFFLLVKLFGVLWIKRLLGTTLHKVLVLRINLHCICYISYQMLCKTLPQT